MAFVLKFTAPRGVFTLDHLSPATTLMSLKILLEEKTGIPIPKLKILHGYPPKSLSSGEESTLDDLGIKSGDSLRIDILADAPQAAGVDAPRAAGVDAPRAAGVDAPQERQDENAFMIIKKVKANNSCLFSSLYYLIVDTANPEIDYVKCESLRELCADEIAKNPTKYSTAFLGSPNQEYCEWIRNRSNWGGGIELAILSKQLNCEIVVIDTNIEQPHWFGQGQNRPIRVFLLYDGTHYDPLVLNLDHTRFFPSYDPAPLQLALNVGVEARARGQNVGMANMSSKCSICQKCFQNQPECFQHARSTGHDTYVQLR